MPPQVSCKEPYEWNDGTEDEWEFNPAARLSDGAKPFHVRAWALVSEGGRDAVIQKSAVLWHLCMLLPSWVVWRSR